MEVKACKLTSWYLNNFYNNYMKFLRWMHYLYEAKSFQNRLVPDDYSADKGLTLTRTSAQNLDDYNG